MNAAVDSKTVRRALPKAHRRQQLIDATIKCISKKGLGNTTLADVAREAGLSQGIVNLHFDSKDNLLNETLRFVAEEYDREFMRTVEGNAESAAQKLAALMHMDLKPRICERSKLAVWFAFWGEVRSVPTYQRICAAYDDKQHDILMELAATIIEEGQYENLDARNIAEGLAALTVGFWLSCLINPKTFDRRVARNSIQSYLHAIFPGHFQIEASG